MRRTTSKLASRRFHQWLIPEKTAMGIFILAVVLVFVGAVLLAVASHSTGALSIIGGILLAVGFVLLIICTILCAHAWCIWHVRDVETQTGVETTILGGADQLDGEWYPAYGTNDKKSPNGVLRDGRQTGSLSKKHVTISPRSDIYSSNYSAGKQLDTSRGSEYSGTKGIAPPSQRSGPGSVSSDGSTLASFAYLNDPSLATPYSTLNQNQKRQNQSQSSVQVPINIQNNYSARTSDGGRTVQVRPYYAEQGYVNRSNLPPVRRHSDDDYDNTGDMAPMLPYQSFQHVPTQNVQWQQHGAQQPQASQWQQDGYQQSSSWQQQQQQQPIKHQINPAYDEPPPAQPLVYPSARRPMTFEQISSSKVSLYDNIHMARRNDDE